MHLTVVISTTKPAKLVVFCQYLGAIVALGRFVTTTVKYQVSISQSFNL